MRDFFIGTSRNDRSTDAGLLILRVIAGLALALGHGLGKMPPSERFIEGVEGMGFPLPPLFAWAAAFSELVGGILLAIGLFARPAAFFILMTMMTALFIRHAADPFAVKEKALLFLSIAVLFLIAGAGRYSIDHLIGRKKAGE